MTDSTGDPNMMIGKTIEKAWREKISDEYDDEPYIYIKMTDKVELEFLRRKIDRMHKEIEFAVDRANDMTTRVNDALKILEELDISNFATGETRKDGSEYHSFNIDQWYAKLKKTLANERMNQK